MVKKNVLVLAVLFATIVSAPALADWLVLRDGTRVETEGPWRVEGRSVVFERPGGPLSSLRLSEVDLEASREATTEAIRETAAEEEIGEEEPAPKEPVLVLRHGDLPVYLVPPGTDQNGEDDSPAREPSATQNGLRVVDWQIEAVEDGLEITGRIENTVSSQRSGIGLSISIRESEDGPPEASATARVERRVLGPDESTSFRARLRDVWQIDGEVHFDLESSSLVVRSLPPGPGESS